MNTKTLLDNFDLLAEAPGGVPKLRELILQLAVRGRLVKQEKEAAHHEGHPAALGKLRRASEEHEGKKEEKWIEGPFELPAGWRWTTLRDVSSELGQRIPDAPFTYVDVAAIDKTRGCIGEGVQVLAPDKAPSRARKIVKRGTVIYSTVRPYLLNIAVMDRNFDPPPIVSTAFFVMHPRPDVDGRFLFYYLRSQPFTDYVNQAMTGMAYPAVNDSKMSVGPFPLPPLPEQKRIVARVDELMKRCDELEARQTERNENRTALTATCLHAVTSVPRKSATPASPEQSRRAIDRALKNFPLIIDTPESVTVLRKTILQLAVQGRLVKQERIHHEGHEEHEEDMEGKRIESPYPLPTGWRWTDLKSNGTINPRNEADDSMVAGFVPMTAVSNIYGVAPEYEPRPWGDIKKGFTHFAEGDVGVAKITPCFQNAKSAIFRNLPNGIGAGTTELHVFRPKKSIVLADYVWIWFKSPQFLQEGELIMTGSAGQKRVPRSYFAETPFPLPPLPEQKRIVAKVNELMALCDALEAKLTQSLAVADTFATAIVHHICNDGANPQRKMIKQYGV